MCVFPDDDPAAIEAQARLEKALDYGLGCTVTQPYLQRIDVDASDETLRLLGLSRTGTAAEVRLIPSVDRVGLPMPVIVEAIGSDRAVLASVQVTMAERTHGRRGITFTGADASSTFTPTITIGHAGRDGWHVTFNVVMSPVSGKHPFAVRPAADLILALIAGNAIQVRAGASVLGPTTRPASTEPAATASPLPHLVVVLDDLQRIYRTAFLIPDEVSHRELRELEMIRELKDSRQ